MRHFLGGLILFRQINFTELTISTFVIKGQSFNAPGLEAGLYLAATPIGNLGDITLRVLESLAGADFIACEDTRVTGKLLQHYAIRTPMFSYHEHNAQSVGEKILTKISEGNAIVLTSDAGTPLVSDPGFRLVTKAKEAGIKVVPLPGASAPVAALIASGLPNSHWQFFGFLSSKQGARRSELSKLKSRPETLIFFESPNRLGSTLADMAEVFGEDRNMCVAREITKIHEEIVTAPARDLIHHFGTKPVKGEVVILVAPDTQARDLQPNELLTELLEEMSVKEAANEAAELTGLPKRELYQLALSIKGNK